MHLSSQMQRFTHETKNIKNMIETFKSEMRQTDLMRRSKSGVNLRPPENFEEDNLMQFNKKAAPVPADLSKPSEKYLSRGKSSSQLRHSIYLDKEHMNKRSNHVHPKFGAKSAYLQAKKGPLNADPGKDETESLRETLNLNFAGMEKIKQKIESTRTGFGRAPQEAYKAKRPKSNIGSSSRHSGEHRKLNFKWEFSKGRGTANGNHIRVETNLMKKNKSASRLGGKNLTPLQKFLEEQTKNMPRWDGSRFVDSSNKNILQLNSKNQAGLSGKKRKKSRVKERMAEMDAELSNYKYFKKNIDMETSKQKEASENWVDDSKASIKYMLVNNYMQDDESESENDNQQILKDLDSGVAFKKSPEPQTELHEVEGSPEDPRSSELAELEGPSPAKEEAPTIPEGFDSNQNYLNILRDFEIYSMEKQNLLSLKACSLFNKNKLVENEFMDVWCDTKKTVSRSTWEVTLLLTFAPKKPDLVISTRLITFEAIEAFPSFINEFDFKNPVGQTFNIKMIGVFKPIDLPKLQINLHAAGNRTKVTRFELPLPFSINKFVSHRKVSDADLIEYVQNSVELASEEFMLDEDYLVRASDLLEILPDLVVFDENLFCMFLDFGSDMLAAVKLEVLKHLEVRVTMYSHQNAILFHDYLKWFLWMFKR